MCNLEHSICRRQRVPAMAGLAASMLCPPPALAQQLAGRVDPPLLAPALTVRWHGAPQRTLAEVLRGRVTPPQMTFTTCTATCPIQGALFAAVRDRFRGNRSDVQLMCPRLEPMADTPAVLQGWLQRQGGGQGRWLAGSPGLRARDAWTDFLTSAQRRPDRHTGQICFFDRVGRLALRTVDFPPA